MKRTIHTAAILFAAGAVACLAAGVDMAAAQEPYFKGKRLTVMINFAAGGPTDIEGRLFARRLGQCVQLQQFQRDGCGALLA